MLTQRKCIYFKGTMPQVTRCNSEKIHLYQAKLFHSYEDKKLLIIAHIKQQLCYLQQIIIALFLVWVKTFFFFKLFTKQQAK